MHKHLRRLQRAWIDWPIYFITTALSSDERFWPQKKSQQYWLTSGEMPMIAMAGRSGAMSSCPTICILLFSRAGCENAANISAGMEAVDEQANDTRAWLARNRLAGRVLRPCLALKGELRPEVGLREEESSARRLG